MYATISKVVIEMTGEQAAMLIREINDLVGVGGEETLFELKCALIAAIQGENN